MRSGSTKSSRDRGWNLPNSTISAPDASSQPAHLAQKKCTEGTKMTQITELTTQFLIRGWQIKFTPERIQQIKNLVERGKSPEEIAELIGVTVASRQGTCSR